MNIDVDRLELRQAGRRLLLLHVVGPSPVRALVLHLFVTKMRWAVGGDVVDEN
jgi:hypothetical protein